MNDDFLHRIRVDPPPRLLADIKDKLDRQDVSPPITRPRAALRTLVIAIFVGSASISIALIVTRSVRESIHQSSHAPTPTSFQGDRLSTSTPNIPEPAPDNTESNSPAAAAAPDQAESVVGSYSGAIQDEDDWILIPAGNFMMGATEEQKAAFLKFGGPTTWMEHARPLLESAGPVHEVHLDSFLILRTEVTVAHYENFIAATGRPHRDSGGRFSRPHQPVVHVSWDDAESYCEWKGARLPTEAEWEKSARGSQSFIYPWGNTWDMKKLQSMDGIAHESFSSFEEYELWRKQHLHGGLPDADAKTADVGSFPEGASPYGVLDMAGNVWEWVADWFGPTYYANSPKNNPKGPATGERKVLRGGAWDAPAPANAAWFRETFMPPSDGRSVTGFRCAKDSPPSGGVASPLSGDGGGKNEDILIRALIANAAGNCPVSLMAADMKADCDRQLPGFKDTLTRLGLIKSTAYRGMKSLKTGPAEVYKVDFEHGDMNWLISTQSDGRILVLWAPNEPHWNVASYTKSGTSQH